MYSFYLLSRPIFFVTLLCLNVNYVQAQKTNNKTFRQRISINEGWRFYKYGSQTQLDNLIYDVRPEILSNIDNKAADARPTEATKIETTQGVLKPWILPSGNDFINDPQKRHARPAGNPGSDFPFVKNDFNEAAWELISLPHDWAIKGPFLTGRKAEVGGGMGRLPVNGVGWYRKKLDIPLSDQGKSIFLDIDGAMSYAMVWLNGNLVGGWPYGYNSWRLDLTPYIIPGGVNQLAIRVDNPNNSSRWYPGGGIYRNVWLTKTHPVHVAQSGTYITTTEVSKAKATINLEVTVNNDANNATAVDIVTEIFATDKDGNKTGTMISSFSKLSSGIEAHKSVKLKGSTSVINPKTWGPPPSQIPNLYLAVTTVWKEGVPIDSYQTRFGIRTVEFNAEKGILVNGELISIKGVNQHHDLGALGAAFNATAAERQLKLLREAGCNAIRMAHNPPAPELLALTDRMGFLVFDEIFDSWELKKTPLDFHLIFPDWHEPDLRNFIRRDRNSPSVIIWGLGNEVGEQYTGDQGAAVAQELYNIVKEEDPTRPIASAMNFAKPNMELPKVFDIISLNYQGEGIRQTPEFEGTERIRTPPQYDAFHTQFPRKLIISSETASTFSSRGTYLFPVSKAVSDIVRDGRGGDSKINQVSAYELHAVDFGSSPDKVFGSIDSHPFVAGEFVWTGWDHLGEPTPYYDARSAYSGMIDLTGFKKDRFYLYQAHWRPELPMVHILPHWNWSERQGEITPVHIFTSSDEAELFLNGKSQGRKKKGQYEYRLRWDSVRYEPGELKVIAYKNGKKWAESNVITTLAPSKLLLTPDRSTIDADGNDLAFITVQIADQKGLLVPRSNNKIDFSITGPGEIVATDNGDPMNMVSFSSNQREAFNGLCLVIVRAKKGNPGDITIMAKSTGLKDGQVKIKSIKP